MFCDKVGRCVHTLCQCCQSPLAPVCPIACVVHLRHTTSINGTPWNSGCILHHSPPICHCELTPVHGATDTALLLSSLVTFYLNLVSAVTPLKLKPLWCPLVCGSPLDSFTVSIFLPQVKILQGSTEHVSQQIYMTTVVFFELSTSRPEVTSTTTPMNTGLGPGRR